MASKDLERLKEQLMKNEAFRAEWAQREPNVELASRIIRLRSMFDLSQRDLARLAGVTQPEIARIESGSSSPRWDTVNKILGAVGASIEITVPAPDKPRRRVKV